MVLVVSELVTDALRHAGGTCTLDLTAHPDSIEVAVHDPSPQTPRMPPSTLTAAPETSGDPWQPPRQRPPAVRRQDRTRRRAHPRLAALARRADVVETSASPARPFPSRPATGPGLPEARTTTVLTHHPCSPPLSDPAAQQPFIPRPGDPAADGLPRVALGLPRRRREAFPGRVRRRESQHPCPWGTRAGTVSAPRLRCVARQCGPAGSPATSASDPDSGERVPWLAKPVPRCQLSSHGGRATMPLLSPSASRKRICRCRNP